MRPIHPARDSRSLRAPATLPRRRILDFASSGLASLALAQLLRSAEPEASRATPTDARSRVPCPHLAPRARRAIHISLVGGLSQVDSFDPKPALTRHHGEAPSTAERPDVFFGQVGRLRRSDWNSHPRGQSGLEVSDLFPHLAERADELTVIRSMVSDTGNHTPALFLLQSGFQANGFPSLGSWLSFGLGSETEELPTFVVIPDARGAPSGGASLWSNAFLPGEHQGVRLEPGRHPVRDLFPPEGVSTREDASVLALLEQMSRRHRASLGGIDPELDARLRSYRLAARLQLSVPEASDLSREPASVREDYGLDVEPTRDFARSCILARRLLERGVRFVQLFSGGPLGGTPRTSWDGHEDMPGNHGREAARIDRPVAALLRDLGRRGLLDDTLVLFTTEFGRTPFTQSAADVVGQGRDHNHAGFSVWLAGAGLKPGIAYGATDEIGHRAVERPVTWHDLHATVLHLFGLEHERLTYYHNGIERRLTNVHGEVIDGILA